MPTVKPALRAARRAKGLKISHLAARIDGLKVQHLANCESGHGRLSIELANRVAQELGVEVGDIVDLDDTDDHNDEVPDKTHPTRRQEQEKSTGPKRATGAVAA